MLLEDFFNAADASAVRRAAQVGDQIELPCAVVHPAARPALALALGLSAEQLEGVLGGVRAFIPGEGAIDESALYDRPGDLDFDELTLADGIAAHAPQLVLRHVPIEAARAAVRNGQRLSGPIDDVDALYIDLLGHAGYLRSMLELKAPGIILRNSRLLLQEAFDRLVALRSGKPLADPWEPYGQLMTGAPASTRCEAPLALFAATRAASASAPRDCFVLRSGFLLQLPFASVVIDGGGEIRDVFPTCGLRTVGSSDSAILFVSGGGAAASTGYFSPAPIVRDLRERRWHVGALPPGVPRYVAGTIGDVKWAIVADLERALGYRVSRGWLGDQCGGTGTSIDGAYAYDGGHFVVEAATGRRVLDMRFLGLQVLSFVRRADGAWRFVTLPLEEDEDADEDEDKQASDAGTGPAIVDENGTRLLALADVPAALAEDGRSVLCASADELALIDIDGGGRTLAFDLRPLAAAVALPEEDAQHPELWRDLLATFGVAERVAEETPDTLRAALAAAWVSVDGLDDATLLAAIAVARRHPKLSGVLRLPLRS